MAVKHQTGSFISQNGSKLFKQSWLVDSPKANLLLIHGLGEHSNRYIHIVDFFNQNNYNVYSYDHIGHGQSEGKRAYIKDANVMRSDLVQAVKDIKQESADLPLFALGHSMGGGILAYTLATAGLDIKSAVLSGAALKEGTDISPFLVKLSKILGSLTPKLPTVKLDSKMLSRDESVVKVYDEDPLVFHKAVPARTGSELLKMMKASHQNAQNVKLPILITHGKADTIANPEGSELFFEEVASEKKDLKIYDELYHEIMNEPEKEQVLGDMLAWLDSLV